MSKRFDEDRVRSRFGILVHQGPSGRLLGWMPAENHHQEPRKDPAGAATAHMERFKRLYQGRKQSLSVWRLDNKAKS